MNYAASVDVYKADFAFGKLKVGFVRNCQFSPRLIAYVPRMSGLKGHTSEWTVVGKSQLRTKCESVNQNGSSPKILISHFS